MSQERPYIDKSTDEIEIIINSNWNNLNLLKVISLELKLRSRRKAQVLFTKVSVQLKELAKQKELEEQKQISADYTLKSSGDNSLINIIKYPEGILGYFGYKVGFNGVSENQRRQILNQIFMETLPPINSPEYMNDWGEPATEKRFKKMVDSVETFIRNARRRKDWENYKQAIKDWQDDVHYLRNTYTFTKTNEYYELYLQAKAKITELGTKLAKAQIDAKKSEEAIDLLSKAQQEIKASQNEMKDLKERVAQSYRKHQNEHKLYQETLLLYDREKAKVGELTSQRDHLQQKVKKSEEDISKLVLFQDNLQINHGIKLKDIENQIAENYLLYIKEKEQYHEAKSQIVQAHKNIETYQAEINKLKESVDYSHQSYLVEQQKYQQTLSLYNEEKAKNTQLLVKYKAISSERDNYIILYNETKAEIKFERHSKASIRGWETSRKAENKMLKKEISDVLLLLKESLTSKDETINNLYIIAERMDRIQSLVDLVYEETTTNPTGMVQKFQRIWLAIKEILSQ
jgi:hypothetical protein